jgi:RecB family endonuclease NucS
MRTTTPALKHSIKSENRIEVACEKGLPEGIRIASGKSSDLKEDDIRVAFERDIHLLEEGLEYVDSEVQMGTGRIELA